LLIKVSRYYCREGAITVYGNAYMME